MAARISVPVNEQGQALLIGSTLVFTLAGRARTDIVSNDETSLALADAKNALIGYAASDANRPGSLPCPDNDNNGNAEAFSGADCPGYVGGSNVYVGRLPWRTLGLPDPRAGGNRERLWYAVSREFARNPSCGAACPLNSDTAGQLTVNGSPAYTNIIAIVFAPGSIIDGQLRDTTNENSVVNYLEGENANGDAVFAGATASTTFNDRLLAITRDVFFPTVELRVAREIRSTLRTYYTTNRYYPNPAPFPGYASTSGTYRGNVPTSTCAPVVTPTYPAWFTTNNWHRVMVYAVAPRCTPKINTGVISVGTQPPCALLCLGPILGLYACVVPTSVGVAELDCSNTTAGPYLTVNGTSTSIESIVMPASYRLGTQPARPCNSISDCLESISGDDENIDAIDNYVYTRPVRSTSNNDNLVIIRP
jgi:hypothetical protein